MKPRGLLPASLFALAVTPSAARWADTPRAAPAVGVRNGHALAYDANRGRVVLFGGADHERVLGDLWEWNGQRWTLLSAGGPPARTFPALAYDRARKRLVLFGGNRVLFGTGEERDTMLGDLWEWDGARWHEVTVPTPPARAEAAMAYDSARGRLVLFGGYRGSGSGRERLGDTWEFDGARWTQLHPRSSPSPRNGAAMAFDAARRRTVLFGGSGGPSAETWEWDGSEWSRVDADSPGRFNAAMAYDPPAQALLRFGGWNGKGREGDTWRYGGHGWENLSRTGPEPRNHSAMAFDEKRGVAVLFGGHDGDRVFGDTWEWRDGRWSRAAFEPPRERIDNGH